MDYGHDYDSVPPVYTEAPDTPWKPDTSLQCVGTLLGVTFANAFPGAVAYVVKLVNGFDVKNETVVDWPHRTNYFPITPETKYRIWIKPIDKHGLALKRSWKVSQPISCSVPELTTNHETTTSPSETSSANLVTKFNEHLATITIISVLALLFLLAILLVVVVWRKRRSEALHRQPRHQPEAGALISSRSSRPRKPRAEENAGSLQGAQQHSSQGTVQTLVKERRGQTAAEVSPHSIVGTSYFGGSEFEVLECNDPPNESGPNGAGSSG